MLTPSFTIEQTDTCVIVRIKAILAKISETEVYIEGCEFKFYSKPYYLRLNLPGEIVDESEKAQYVADEGTFVITICKKKPGEYFEGLDMLTRLLAPTGKISAEAPIIEVLDSHEHCEEESDQDETEDFDWQIEQELYLEPSITNNGPHYGFANQRSGIIGRLQEELRDIIELEDADHVPVKSRSVMRIQHEQQHFDDDHYLADLYEDDTIQALLEYKPDWEKELKKMKHGHSADDAVKLSKAEQEKMLKLPRKDYLLDKQTEQLVLLGLVDILFAYAFNNRIAEGDENVESSWNIRKVSSTLSWLDTPCSLLDVVKTCKRRGLCYPLYRHWDLVNKVLKDTHNIIKTGRRRILKCLLTAHTILRTGDNSYVLNDLYLTDYCVWIQQVKEKHIKSLANALSQIKVDKGDLNLDLIELEQAANMALQEQQLGNFTDQEMSNVLANDYAELSLVDENKSLVTDITSELESLNIEKPSKKTCSACSRPSSAKYYMSNKRTSIEQNACREQCNNCAKLKSVVNDEAKDGTCSTDDASCPVKDNKTIHSSNLLRDSWTEDSDESSETTTDSSCSSSEDSSSEEESEDEEGKKEEAAAVAHQHDQQSQKVQTSNDDQSTSNDSSNFSHNNHNATENDKQLNIE